MILQIFIKVLDVNDNVPKVMNEELKLSVYEDAKVGSILHQVVAHDLDLG